MKIITCLKEVPARDARYELSHEGKGIKESDLTFEINECDEYSLEEALKMREAHGGEVSARNLPADAGVEFTISLPIDR